MPRNTQEGSQIALDTAIVSTLSAKNRSSWFAEKQLWRSTDQPAQVFGFKNRGLLREENFADFVLFDPDEINDLARFETPCKASCGIELVAVNEQIAFRRGKATDARYGRMLSRVTYQNQYVRNGPD